MAHLEAPAHVKSIPGALKEAADRYPERGIHLYDALRVKDFMSYPQLYEGALRVAASFQRQRLEAGARLLMVVPNHFDFIQIFFGALIAQIIPIPVSPPRTGLDKHLVPYLGSLRRLAKRLGVRHLISSEDPVLAMAQASFGFDQLIDARHLIDARRTGFETTTETASRAIDQLGRDTTAYIQLSSGTTGPTRGAVLTHGNLLANIVSIGVRLELNEDDVGVSWLPLFNDMGLVGALLVSIVWGLPLVMIDPDLFLRHPHEWLWAFPNHKATMSLAPDFGYHHCTRRTKRSDIDGLDLSTWRLAIAGGEPIHPIHVQTFERRFRPYGLRKNTVVPVYGLGEATLAASSGAPASRLLIDRLDRERLEKNREAHPARPGDKRAVSTVAVGAALDGVQIAIRDPATKEFLGDGQVGEVFIRGNTVMHGYCEIEVPRPGRPGTYRGGQIDSDGWLATGDLGYKNGDNDQLYVVGRLKDVIRFGARQLSPNEFESLIARLDGVRPNAVAVFGVPVAIALAHPNEALRQLAENAIKRGQVPKPGKDEHGDGPEMVIVAIEVMDGLDLDRLTQAIEETLLDRIGIKPSDIQLLSLQSIPRTRSGKVQRYKCRRLYLEGQLDRRDRQERWQSITNITDRARSAAAQFGRRLRNFFDNDH